MKQIPTEQEFIEYGVNQLPDVDPESVRLKYQAWLINDWKTGKNKPIKNWKSTLTNTLIHLPKRKFVTSQLDKQLQAHEQAKLMLDGISQIQDRT